MPTWTRRSSARSLRCLESDPLQRPASASLVAAALPGGDPLAAAIAAGETPSPEMVAAAGGEGALRPAVAWAWLASAGLLIVAALSLTGISTTLGLAPLPKSPDALEERAREIARGFGYTSRPADTSRGWILDGDYSRYRAQHVPSPARVKTLESARPGPLVFLYRQSPRPMIPNIQGIGITRDDPPLSVSGMLSVELDREGRLTRFLAVPPQVIDTAAPAPAVGDWTALLAAAGLDPAQFHPSSPKWAPPVESDARAAWEGSFPEDPKTIVRAEAAAYAAKPVYFELVGPWSRPERMQESQMPLGERIGNAVIIGFVVAVLVLGGVIARRNLRLGRADRAGALRVSWVLFCLSFAQWLVSGHHAADLGEFISILRTIGEACFWALYIGVMYLALEPYVRRRWPDVLISWSRLLSGRLRDPLVGRDLLAGVVGASIVALNYLLLTALPAWFDISGLTPLSPDPMSLRGIGGLLGVALEQPRAAVLIGEGALFMVFLVATVVRRRGVAIAIVVLFVLLPITPRENLAVELPFVIVDTLVLMVLLFRFGLLATVMELWCTWALLKLPLTLDPSRFYFGYGMLGIVIVLGLATYAFHTSLGGQKAFGGLALEE